MLQIQAGKPHPVAVIFAGGDGTRLWPVSTHDLPKQVNPLFSKKTLFLEAYERVIKLFPKEQVVVVTTQAIEEKVRHLVDLPKKNWIIQPHNADTGVAMCLTALHLEAKFPESIAVLFYSDHRIRKFVNFAKAIEEVIEIAENYPFLITIGTKPTFANTHFGYIKLGDIHVWDNFYNIEEFREKPDLKTAKRYYDSGEYVWNTGVYAWQARALLQELKSVASEYYQGLVNLRVLIGEEGYALAMEKWFGEVRPESFDRMVSEKLKSMLVYVADYRWEDVGNWHSVYELAKKDEQGNAVLENNDGQSVEFRSSEGCMVVSNAKQVMMVGLKDVYVVQTDEALLICNKDHVAEVKK
jgi:mannose-1-phosphate guanylyltransferase